MIGAMEFGIADHRECASHEQAAQIAVTLFVDTAEPLTAACPWRIHKLRCCRHLEQTMAMVPPRVIAEDGVGGRRLARSFSRSAAAERQVNAIFIVIISEFFQL